MQLCHSNLICVDHCVDIRPSSYRPPAVYFAQLEKSLSQETCFFFTSQSPKNPSLVFLPLEATETESQTGDWQSDCTPGEVFTLRQNLAGSPSRLHHYSCEASGKTVAASNGHRWHAVRRQLMCEYLFPLLHSFKGTESTLHCTKASQHKC